MAKKIIDSNKLGKILNFRCVYGKSKMITFETNDWRSKRKFSGGGILLDQGIHMLDLIKYFYGEFSEFYSCISNNYWNYNVEDNAFILLRDKKGVVAFLHSTATQWQHKFLMEITLQKGSIELGGILSGTKSYGSETLNILSKNDIDTDPLSVLAKEENIPNIPTNLLKQEEYADQFINSFLPDLIVFAFDPGRFFVNCSRQLLYQI